MNQPWAWAILSGAKRFENRIWKTHYRGEVLIHASKTTEWFAESSDEWFRQRGVVPPDYTQLPLGALVGTVRIVDCLPISEVDDPWAVGPWCWKLDRPRRLIRPIPCVGRLGFFECRISSSLPQWVSDKIDRLTHEQSTRIDRSLQATSKPRSRNRCLPTSRSA